MSSTEVTKLCNETLASVKQLKHNTMVKYVNCELEEHNKKAKHWWNKFWGDKEKSFDEMKKEVFASDLNWDHHHWWFQEKYYSMYATTIATANKLLNACKHSETIQVSSEDLNLIT